MTNTQTRRTEDIRILRSVANYMDRSDSPRCAADLRNLAERLQAAWTRKPSAQVAGADFVNTTESLKAAIGSIQDFADAADLVDALGKCETNGDMLGLVLSYRQKVRMANPAPEPVSVPVHWQDRMRDPNLEFGSQEDCMQAELAEYHALADKLGWVK